MESQGRMSAGERDYSISQMLHLEDSTVMFQAMATLISNIEMLYAEARRQWSMVDWPLELYREHLGSDQPRYPVDMYLGGAAGYRLDSAWDSLHTQLAPRVKTLLARKPRADMTEDDLWSETLVNILKDDARSKPLPDGCQPAMIIRYRGMATLVSYLVTAAVRIAISRNRARKETPMAFDSGRDENEPGTIHMAPDETRPDTLAANREQAELFSVKLHEALNALPAEDHYILTAVFRDGIRQKRVAELLGVKNYYITRRIQAAAAAVRESMSAMAAGEWNDELDAAWESVWSKFCRENDNEAQFGKSQTSGIDDQPQERR